MGCGLEFTIDPEYKKITALDVSSWNDFSRLKFIDGKIVLEAVEGAKAIQNLIKFIGTDPKKVEIESLSADPVDPRLTPNKLVSLIYGIQFATPVTIHNVSRLAPGQEGTTSSTTLAPGQGLQVVQDLALQVTDMRQMLFQTMKHLGVTLAPSVELAMTMSTENMVNSKRKLVNFNTDYLHIDDMEPNKWIERENYVVSVTYSMEKQSQYK